MPRRTTSQTRDLLLEVGLELLYAAGPRVGVGHIRLADVAQAAGFTTGAAYRCWSNQEAFHRDLAIAAVRHRDRPSIAETVENIRRLVDERAPLAEVIRVGAAANVYKPSKHLAFLTTIALRSSAAGDPAIAEAGRYHLETAVESFAGLYAALLHVYRRRMRPPFTVRDLTLTLAALSEGFALQGIVDHPHPRMERDDLPPAVGRDWTALGCAIEAVVEHFTEPVE